MYDDHHRALNEHYAIQMGLTFTGKLPLIVLVLIYEFDWTDMLKCFKVTVIQFIFITIKVVI